MENVPPDEFLLSRESNQLSVSFPVYFAAGISIFLSIMSQSSTLDT